jgi:hypothetical protein
MWVSPAPTKCDLDRTHSIVDEFYDASIPLAGGSWGILCKRCFNEAGCRLGTGYGQKYQRLPDGKYECVAGGRNETKESPHHGDDKG